LQEFIKSTAVGQSFILVLLVHKLQIKISFFVLVHSCSKSFPACFSDVAGTSSGDLNLDSEQLSSFTARKDVWRALRLEDVLGGISNMVGEADVHVCVTFYLFHIANLVDDSGSSSVVALL